MTQREPTPPDLTEETSDRELVARAQQRDAAAYDELVRRYYKRIYALL